MARRIRKNKQSYTTYDMYTNFCAEVDDTIPYSIFHSVLERLNDKIKKCVLYESGAFKMPYGLGTVIIGKYKPKTYNRKSLSIDYKSTKLYDKLIYHLNEHSDGYKFRMHWSKIPVTFPDMYRYQLSLTRSNKRELAKLIFNNHDYIDINDIQIYKV